jgi:hypothetical protein
VIKTVIGISLLLLMLPAFETNFVFAEIHVTPGAQKKKAPAPMTMWSITKKRKSYFLSKRTMSRNSVDKMLAEDLLLEVEPIKKGDKSLLLPGDGRSIIYFAGIGEFQPGPLVVKEFHKTLVNTFSSAPKKVPLTSSVDFEFNYRRYTLSVALESAGVYGGWNMRVYLKREKRRQLLCSYREAQDASAWLEWVADIDRDGAPDLLVTTSPHHAMLTTRLYLSSRARKGSLVGEVARFSQGD